MKRTLCSLAICAALIPGTIPVASAHVIDVDPAGGGQGTGHSLAVGTPRLFPDGSDPNTAPDSAASQGTNVACEAIPDTAPVTITGGSC